MAADNFSKRGEWNVDQEILGVGRVPWGKMLGTVEERLERSSVFTPTLCRVDDGPPDRMDSSRLVGNGVCPDVAAKAFVTLYGQLVDAPQ